MRMYSLLGDDSSEHKNAKTVNKNVVETIKYGEYRDAFCRIIS